MTQLSKIITDNKQFYFNHNVN